MNLIKLQIVELLNRHQKITAVADELGLKQPTVTFHMKSLEKEMGVTLFESRGGKILLREPGKALLHYATKINALAAESKRIVQEFGALERGQLRIGASYVPATYFLPDLIHTFSHQHPGVQLSIAVKTAPVIRDMLINHEIDMGIMLTEPFEHPALVKGLIGEDQMVVIFTPDHPLANEAELNLEVLQRSRLVLHSHDSSTRQISDRWMRDSGLEIPSFIELDSAEAIKRAVMLGGYAAFLSRMAVEEELRSGRLHMHSLPDQQLRRYLYYAYNKERHYSGLIHRFAACLNEPTAALGSPTG
ncbi:LysR family transcriptional regulator [Paenibacillus hunanensis]|uniref:DNA-binding transcriptional LysR family regulator n=1 Tax=Paenibacillus hunanensis TaxID=539262 RepID=A0ABU1IYZ7_9BACL|nr:LysR family transcriptional regulator [Paenibacillus hunanensis]MDR6244487.1 DNA-binding transcriptional LysR family regulator [Paenibacillus hunanensis]GGI99746.1 LysR family transcriptional regulator [Paenibacillus hunanensis]